MRVAYEINQKNKSICKAIKNNHDNDSFSGIEE